MIRFGCRWDFLPRRELFDSEGFSFLSLRLESLLKYGGPALTDFKKARERGEVRVFSDYLPMSDWDEVHRQAARAFFQTGEVRHLSCRSGADVSERKVKELLELLPSGVEASILVQNQDSLMALESLNGVFVSVAASDWFGRAGVLSHSAEQIFEIEVSASDLSTRFDANLKVIGEVVQAKKSRDLNVCFVLPLRGEAVSLFEAAKKFQKELHL